MEQKAFEMALAFQRGEENGFEYFYKQYYREVVFFGYKIFGDIDIARDFGQNAFLKIWKSHNQFSHPLVIKSWLYVTVKNEALNFINKKKRTDIWEKSAVAIFDDHEEPIEHQIIRKETISNLYKLIKRLPPSCRKVFELRYIKDIPVREIASCLGVEISTVKNQKARGVELIRDMLEKSKKVKVIARSPIVYIDRTNLPKELLKKTTFITLLQKGDKPAWEKFQSGNYERFYRSLSLTKFSHEQKVSIIEECIELAKANIMQFSRTDNLLTHVASSIKALGVGRMTVVVKESNLSERMKSCKVVFDLKQSGLTFRQVAERLGLVIPTTSKMYYEYVSHSSNA